MRLIYIVLACLSLVIAFIGILLPGLPATEFVLLSVWLAGKGSPRLQAWMLRQSLIATIYHDWHNGRVIRLKFKIWSSLSMLFCLSMMMLFIDHLLSVAFAATGMAIGAWYIWSRPHTVAHTMEELSE